MDRRAADTQGSGDPPFGIVTVDRLLTPAEARACIAEIARLARLTRERIGRARVLIDASAGTIQPGDVAAPVALDDIFPGTADRLAILVSGTLLAIQARRVLHHAGTCVFQDRAAAVAWPDEPFPTADPAAPPGRPPAPGASSS